MKSESKKHKVAISKLMHLKRTYLRQGLLMVFIFALNFTGYGKGFATDSIAPDKIRIYKTVNGADLALHVFNPEQHRPTDATPVIVFFFGGGWTGGTPKQFYEQSRYFAEKGIVAISAEYRVKSIHGTTPFEAVEDAKSAIRWVRQHAEELGIHPDKIVASGGSAGGHVALSTGVIEGYENSDEDVSISSVPNAMIAYNPVLDTTEKGYGMAKVGENRKTDISPNHHIQPGVVPTLIFHGTADKTVPFENAERFNSLMKAAGNQVDLEAYEGKGHGFFNGAYFREKQADSAVYNDIMAKSYTFLVSTLQQLKLSSVFSDHMVLQQGMPVPIWGTAPQGQKIKITFAGQEKSTVANEKGMWRVQLDTLKTSTTGSDLVVSGERVIRLTDVLVGEVWICSGQSNMQMPVAGIPEIEALLSKAKHIRSFEVKKTVSLDEKTKLQGQWSLQPPNSAVAFSFAYFLEEMGEVPVGIIHSSWGSSSIEAWMPRDMTEQFDYFKTIMHDFDADVATHKRIDAILAKKDDRTTPDDIFLRRQPNILYNAMIKPLAPFAARGFVWYQGERNTRYLSGMPEYSADTWFHRVSGMQEYGDVLKAYILRYRQEWQNPNLQFMVVMLPGFGKGTVENPEIDPKNPTEQSWAWMRESQLKALQLPNTSVINTIDLGDVKNVHPKDKLPIGRRLALEAAKKTLGQDRVAEGPILDHVEVKRQKLVVHYSNVQDLKTSDGKAPTGFWVADDAMQWKPAQATIKDQTVVLLSKQIKRPLYIRYAFAGKPDVNLVNGAGLPAYPFRTDSETD